jgi:hypothetical protein
VQAVLAHPKMQDSENRDRSLVHVWDFVMRTRYILSELDNIAAGRPIQHPDQIAEYREGGD